MTIQTETIDTKPVEALRARLRGALLRPGEAGYDEARAAWNLNARQRPAVVVMAESADDVLAAVRFARDEGLGVGVMATGHGTAAPSDGGVLVNTSRMNGVRVDPVARTARVEAGAKWADVVPEAQKYGLAGLTGSSTQVGVVGYTMGGGFGWPGRKYGFNADSVIEAEVVTAGGELVRASAHENPDLLHVAEAVKPHTTETTYVNYLDLDGATPDRVRAAYSSADWERLVQLKDCYDQHNLFRFNRTIPPSSAASASAT